jgi:hypothetical protein
MILRSALRTARRTARHRSSFVLGMIVGAGALGGGIVLGGAGQPDDPGVVRARQFEVVDEVGTVRLVVGANDDGGSISIRDRLGRTVLLAGATPHGGTLVVSGDGSSAGPALVAGATATGGAVRLLDTEGRAVADLASGATGGRLALTPAKDEREGRPALELGVAPDDGGIVQAFGPLGERMAGIYGDRSGRGVIETYHAAGSRPLVTLSSSSAGHGQVKTAAANGQPLVHLTATADNDGQIYTYGPGGAPLVAIASRPSGPAVRIYSRSGEPLVTLEAAEDGDGRVGVWSPDGSGRTIRP